MSCVRDTVFLEEYFGDYLPRFCIKTVKSRPDILLLFWRPLRWIHFHPLARLPSKTRCIQTDRLVYCEANFPVSNCEWIPAWLALAVPVRRETRGIQFWHPFCILDLADLQICIFILLSGRNVSSNIGKTWLSSGAMWVVAIPGISYR